MSFQFFRVLISRSVWDTFNRFQAHFSNGESIPFEQKMCKKGLHWIDLLLHYQEDITILMCFYFWVEGPLFGLGDDRVLDFLSAVDEVDPEVGVGGAEYVLFGQVVSGNHPETEEASARQRRRVVRRGQVAKDPVARHERLAAASSHCGRGGVVGRGSNCCRGGRCV